MEIHIEKVSKKLKDLREEKNFTQEELAHHLGVTRQSVIALEQGRCLPSLPLVLNFIEIFQMPFESIFCDQLRREVNNFMANDLAPWSPLHEASQLHEAIDRLFEESSPQIKMPAVPAMNVYEKNKQVIVEVDVPGVKEEDIAIEVGEDTLEIRGEKKQEKEIKDKDYFRKETSYGVFSRTIQLPAIVNKDKAQAELKDGQLIITLPKKAGTKPKVTKIKVKKV